MVIQMVQTMHTSANILHVCIHKNVLTMLQYKLLLKSTVNKLNFSVIWRMSIFTNATNKVWSLFMTGLADVDAFQICIEVPLNLRP